MGTWSSGEDLVVKARKPYTITKLREKWTEEEHNKFLEALKLYGRAWQRIEEHIGTKTAVQIRSHAQKFFSKLEKEAVAKGIPLGEVHDIQIPPPRPKRKPNNPYPRKICDGVVSSCVEGKDDRRTSSFSSSLCSKKTTDLELSDHNKKHARNQRLERTEQTSIDSKFLESLSHFGDAQCVSIWSAGKTPIDASVSGEFVLSGKPKDNEHYPIVEENVQDVIDMDIDSLHRLSIDTEVKLTEERKVSQKQLQNCCMTPKIGVGSSKNYPKHVPVHSIDGHNNGSVENRGADATNVTSVSNKVEVHTSLNFGTIPCISAATGLNNSTSMYSVQRPFATYPPFMQFLGAQDACRSSNNISSTFSGLIVSTLVQNPAAHSAASLAASFWPSADIETPIGSASGTLVGGIPVGHANPSPSMTAIAAATVAAASAWWATHGMLPFYHPFQSCFTFAPAPTSTNPGTETTQTTGDNGGREFEVVAHDHLPINLQSFDPQCSKALGTKSAPLSSSGDSDDSQGGGTAHALQQKSPAHNHPNLPPDSHLPESIKARSRKTVDHSSCGSNALSNSEMEKAKALKNLEEGKGEPTDVNLTHPSSVDTSNRRPRGNSNASESWKSVSEEGRLAFEALFSRDILPQSFSPAHAKGVMKNGVVAPPAELNGDACPPAGNGHAHVADRNCPAHEGIKIGKDPPNNGIGQWKLKSHRTGFKPYKRCSMEANENKADPVEEKCNKRIHLEGKTSL